MKTIHITENQKRKLFNESRGVPDDGIEISKDIVKEFLDNIDEMYQECLDEMDSSYDDDWEDAFEYDFYVESWREYHINVFMDSRSPKKADTDTDGEITINFAPIKRKIDNIKQRYNNLTNEQMIFRIRQEIYSFLYPIILHELTHDADEVGGNHDYVWLGKHHYLNSENLRDILYLFSDQEMNARISSSYALMEDYLEQCFQPSWFRDKVCSTNEMSEMIDEVISEEDELRIKDMETMLFFISEDIKFSDRNYITRAQKEKITPYSLPYDLFNNDKRLKKNRKLKQLFKQNYKSAAKYVYNYYNRLFDQYKDKIKRVCIKAIQDFAEREDNEGFRQDY